MVTIDEYKVLQEAKKFLEKEFRCKVEIYKADDKTAPDPGKKKKRAKPNKPGIYIE